ncbi:MAG: septation regulator SpoVG [Eubacteriales bacterium]|nr:septation regulator SpoVG [Eubacteriales bacterium]
MKITDVRIRKITDDDKMKAIVSITLDKEFVVHDIKIINGNNGMFIAMPSKRLPNGEFRDVAHPLTPEAREKICDAIFKEYNRVLEEQNAEIVLEKHLLADNDF